MSSSGAFGEFQQSVILNILDLSFTVILIISGIATFLTAIFVYYRILVLPAFRTQYLMKLFAFNGAMNILVYFMYLVSTQFANWPSTHVIYTWHNNTFAPPVFLLLAFFASCAQWQSQFCISLNRLLSMKHDFMLEKHGRLIYLASLWSSFLLTLIISVPTIFSGYHYVEIEVNKGVYAYIPVSDEEDFTIPAIVHQLGFAVVTHMINALTCVVLMMMRREFKNQSKNQPEQGELIFLAYDDGSVIFDYFRPPFGHGAPGIAATSPYPSLLLSSFCSTFLHILHDVVLLVVYSTGLVGLSYFVTLFVAISTTLPFWTMIGFAHTMRRAVISGTIFESNVSVGLRHQNQSISSRP